MFGRFFGGGNEPTEVQVEEISPLVQPITDPTEPTVFEEEEAKIERKLTLKHPGKFEDFNREHKEITKTHENFDGVQADMIKIISENFNLHHQIALGSAQDPPSYNFSCFCALNNKDKKKAPTVLNGRINTEGNLMGKIRHSLTRRTTGILQAQTGNEPHTSQVSAELEYEGKDWHGHFKWVNPGIFGIGYFQSITNRLALGVDMYYKNKETISVNTYAARYEGNNWIGTLMYHQALIQATYTHKVSEKLGLSTEIGFQRTPNGFENMYNMGFQYNMRNNGLFRGHIDSTGKVYGLLEEVILPILKFTLSGELDHSKKQYKFGIGLSLMTM